MPGPGSWLCALLLVVAANAVPWSLGQALRGRFAAPLDFGLSMPDGERLFGAHKTWRGLASGALACALAATLCGHSPGLGLAFGGLSLAGDACSSALKRRLRLTPGSEVPLVDQLGEALLPLVVLRAPLGITWPEVFAVTVVFTALDIAATALRHRR